MSYAKELGREIIGWEIFNKKVLGLKIFTINYIDKNYILASYEDWRGKHQLKFSAKTGKQWRKKPWEQYYHLENRRVKRWKYIL